MLFIFIIVTVIAGALDWYANRSINKYNASHDDQMKPIVRKIANYGLGLIVVIIGIVGTYKGSARGATTSDYLTTTPTAYIKDVKNSFKHTQPINGQIESGSIIILYRFSCPDCHKITADTQAIINDPKYSNLKVYYITDQSDLGRNIARQAGVSSVPAVIYNSKHHGIKRTTLMSNDHQGLNRKNLTNYLDMAKRKE